MLNARILAGAALVVLACLIAPPVFAAAPYVAGNRTFPVTPTTEDPFVADEISAKVTHSREDASDSEPVTRETEFEFEVEKRITENLGISVEGSYEIIEPEGEDSAHGFGNLDAILKYQFYTNDVHELVISAGVIREFGGTGSKSVGAERIGSTTPTLYFGKGFGDLPEELKYLRPIAVTGTFGYQFADQRTRTTTEVDPNTGVASASVEHLPDFVVIGFALEYSLRYLQGNVQYVGLPVWLTRLTPLVEFAYTTPATRSYGEPSTGVIAPGVIYSDLGLDFGLEAQLPLTSESGTGFVAKLAVPLERIGPSILGKPLFGD
jgi:hypothetical protein